MSLLAAVEKLRMVIWPPVAWLTQPKVVHGLSASFLRTIWILGFACTACSGTIGGDVQPPDAHSGGEGGQGGEAFKSSPRGGSPGSAGGAAGNAGTGGATAPGGGAGTTEPPIPEGLVPVVVALGPGGRTAVSCNGGRQFRVNDFHKTPDDDHSPYASTGLAGGKGAVIATAGWGAAGRVFYSENAVDWQELPSTSYTNAKGEIGPSTESTSGAFYDGEIFRVFWSQRIWASSRDGKIWKETAFEPPDVASTRNVEYYPKDNLLLLRVDRDEGGRRHSVVLTSTDQGKTYKSWSPDSTGCPGFQYGAVAYSHGVMLAGGLAGSVCRSDDGGASWAPIADLTNIGAIFADETAFFIARFDELLRSEDGKTWTRVHKANVNFGVGIWSAATGYVVSADAGGQLKFFRSDNGQTWVESAAVTGTTFGPRFMRTALVKPSPKCAEN